MASIEVNGRPVSIGGEPAERTLLDWLRGQGLTGTKEGCAEGDCGACTVAVREPGGAWRSVCSCLMLVHQQVGARVVTVEGLAGPEGMHPAQDAVVAHLASQCGYCTPGVVMTLFEATYRDDLVDAAALEDQVCGTLCRCTGYRPIRDALLAVAGRCPADGFRDAVAPGGAPSSTDRFAEPETWQGLWDALERWPEARLVAGATDVGLEITRQHRVFPAVVSLSRLPGATAVADVPGGWRVGAGVRLSDLEAAAATRMPGVATALRYFGSRQIKNRATVGGNLANASPIGDLAPVFLALGATLVIRGRDGDRRVAIDGFFEAYRRTALRPGEVLLAVELPDPGPTERVGVFKASKRRELDISAVSAAFLVGVVDGVVTTCRLAFGGMAATPTRARLAEAALLGGPCTAEARARAVAALAELTPIDDHRASAWYRAAVAARWLEAFLAEGEAP